MRKILVLLTCLSLALAVTVRAQEAKPAAEAPAAAGAESKGQPAVEQPKADDQAQQSDTSDKSAKKETTAAKEKPFGLDASIGSEIIDGKSYLALGLQPELTLGKFGIGLDIMFRFDGQFQLYKPDWIPVGQAILKKIDYVRWGLKGEPIFAKLGLLDDVYLGHGTILYRFSNKLFLPAQRKFGLQFDLDLTKFGFEMFDDDLMYNHVVGSRIYLRPFAKKVRLGEGTAEEKKQETKFLNLNKWAIGLTGAADIALKGGTNCVFLGGVDLDMPILDLKNIFSILLYTDIVKNFNFAGLDGSGWTLGAKFTLFGFDFIGEYYRYGRYFDGPYFNVFYDIQRKTRLAELASKTNQTQGWGFRMNRDFFGYVKFGFNLYGASSGYLGMHFEALMEKKIAGKFSAGFSYDKINIWYFKDVFIADDDAAMNLSLLYSISKSVDLVVGYSWAFSVNKKTGKTEAVPNLAISTKFNFF